MLSFPDGSGIIYLYVANCDQSGTFNERKGYGDTTNGYKQRENYPCG